MARRRQVIPGCSRFDVAEAYYVFAAHHHGGQGSKEYAIFSRLEKIKFKPRPSLRGRKSLSECGKLIYDGLVRRKRR